MHPEFERFLNMTYLGSPVKDLITVNYAFLALPYHHASWIPHRLLPYIIDQCLSPTNNKCYYKEYMNFTFDIRDQFLEFTNTTYDNLQSWWINQVNSKFDWNLYDLRAVYNRNTTVDPHNSEMRSRAMWKYAADQGVFATPTAFVNGIHLQNMPWTAEEWL